MAEALEIQNADVASESVVLVDPDNKVFALSSHFFFKDFDPVPVALFRRGRIVWLNEAARTKRDQQLEQRRATSH